VFSAILERKRPKLQFFYRAEIATFRNIGGKKCSLAYYLWFISHTHKITTTVLLHVIPRPSNFDTPFEEWILSGEDLSCFLQCSTIRLYLHSLFFFDITNTLPHLFNGGNRGSGLHMRENHRRQSPPLPSSLYLSIFLTKNLSLNINLFLNY